MFSVIVPAYNAARTLEKSVNCVLKQTYDDFEVLIIDDGSSDDTRAAAARFEDPRIRYYYKENGGVSSARNKGISLARGDYICLLDSDDEWLENHLETLDMLIKKYNDARVFLTGYCIRLHSGELVHTTENRLARAGVTDADFLAKNCFALAEKCGTFFHTNSFCCHKSTFENVGTFAEGVKIAEDTDMWYRLFAYYDVAISKAATTIYDRTDSTATNSRKHVFLDKWVFFHRADAILNDDAVSAEKKACLYRNFESRRVSDVRYLLICGDKKGAKEIFRKIDRTLVAKKRYLVTKLCLYAPTWFIKRYVEQRDRDYFAER